MLKFLSIENFALIDRLEIEFGGGLNLVTGETGSGKSILVGAVGLLSGSRAAQEMVRQGFQSARVEGLFELDQGHPARILLEEGGIEAEDGQLVVRREIALEGGNKVFVNGRLSTAGFLGELGAHLVDIHGQHDQQQLLRPSNHLEFLDAFGGNERLLEKVQGAFQGWRDVKRQIQAIREGERDRLQRLDTLRYQLAEIEKLQLEPGLDEQLREERRLLSTSEKRLSNAREGFARLYEREGSAMELVGRSSRNLEELAQADPAMKEAAQRLEELRYGLEEVAFQLRDYQDGIEFNPARLEAVEQRLAEIQQACRKYGKDVAEILDYRESLEPEIEELEASEERAEELEKKERRLSQEYFRLAEELSAKRAKDAENLSRAVEKELADLAMRETVFQVDLQPDRENASSGGVDRAQFLISPNPGEEPRPLAKIASGGELSRIILALKSILTLERYAKTLVFDEVDSGVGGRAASGIGEKLSALSGQHQVFCVTHLPQVACYATRHLKVDKDTREGRTTVGIRRLAEGERLEELSRMLAGDQVTEATVEHARDLLQQAGTPVASQA